MEYVYILDTSCEKTEEIEEKTVDDLMPDEFRKITINDLMSTTDIEVHKKGDKLEIKQKTPEGEIKRIEYTAYSGLETLNKSIANSKWDDTTIKKLYKGGRTQEEIASIIGSSQPTISRILNGQINNKK